MSPLPCPGAITLRDHVDLPPRHEEHLGHRVLGVGPRRGSPATERRHVVLVGLEQRVETLPPARFFTHVAPRDWLCSRHSSNSEASGSLRVV
jgi:hypothetical protein